MSKVMKIGGKPVVDAKKSINLTITEGDVRDGKKKTPDCCAAALACRREWGAEQAHVYLSRIYIELGGKWLRFKTPLALRTEIISFDRGYRFTPGVYTLGRISESQRVGVGHHSRGTHPNKGRPGVKSPQRGRRAKPAHVDGVRFRAGTEMAKAMGFIR